MKKHENVGQNFRLYQQNTMIRRQSCIMKKVDLNIRKLLCIVMAFVCASIFSGCSSEPAEDDGGFIRKIYSGIVETQIEENGNCYLRVNTEQDGSIDFLITDTSEMNDGARISDGDAVEIDCVHWYGPSTYEILSVTVTERVSDEHERLNCQNQFSVSGH